MEEELPIALGPLEGRRRYASDVPAAQNTEARHPGYDRLVMAGVSHHAAFADEPLPDLKLRGLINATASPSDVSTLKTEGRTFSSEMKETSMVASFGASGKESGGSCRALVFSMTTTRPSARSVASSCPWPTSTA